MNYVIIIKELSSGSIEKSITSYDNKDTALRKFHEAFNVIGGGPKRITSILMEDVITQRYDTLTPNVESIEENLITTYSTEILKNETWVYTPEPSEETPTE